MTKLTWQISSTSSDDTILLGELFGRLLKGGEIIELRADLGGGKTTFVRGLAAGLGSKSAVTSPTFTISKSYPARNNLLINHFDFYRLDEPGLVADQLAESVGEANIITVVEWSDKVQGVLPNERYTIEFTPSNLDPEARDITINYPETASDLFKELESAWFNPKP